MTVASRPGVGAADQPPRRRTHWIDRPRLSRLLDHAPPSDPIVVAAPAGYGKTVLLAQWARSRGDVAWWEASTGRQPAIRRTHRHVVVDAAERLVTDGDAAALLELLDAVPAHVRPVVLTRRVAASPSASPPLPLTIGPEQLAFSPSEVARVLGRVAPSATHTDRAEELSLLSGGWPSLVVGAVDAVAAGRTVADAWVEVLCRHLVDAEVWSDLPPPARHVLAGCALLPDLPVDVVADLVGAAPTASAGRVLASWLLVRHDASTGASLTPTVRPVVGAQARWRLAASSSSLHRSAAAWCRSHGRTRQALEHLVEAGDARAAVDHAAGAWAATLFDGVDRVTAWWPTLPVAARRADPRMAVMGSWLAALDGDEAMAQEVQGCLASTPDATEEPTFGTVRTARDLHAGLFGHEGVARMVECAASASGDLGGRWPGLVAVARAMALVLIGDPSGARSVVAGIDPRAPRTTLDLVLSDALLALSLVDDDAGAAMAAARRAVATAQAGPALSAFAHSVAHAALGTAASRAGRVDLALGALELAVQLAPRSPHPCWHVAHARIELARVHARRDDRPRVVQALTEVARVLDEHPDAGVLAARLSQAAEELDVDRGVLAPVVLTPRQRAVVDLLASTMSGREIAAALGISYETFRSHRRALYAALGVRSRTDAVTRSRLLGAGAAAR